MGQATLDLPDPLEPAAAPASHAAADDLLAQLANDEIDRLLAEAEVEPMKNGKPASPATAPTRSPAADAAFDTALKGPAGSPRHDPSNVPPPQLSPQAQTLPVVAGAPAPPVAPTISQQMQQVFAGTTPVTAAAPGVLDAPAAAKVVDAKVIDTQIATTGPAVHSNGAELTPVVVAPVDGGTSLAERDGLRAGEIEALTADPLGDLEEPEPEARVALVLKPLVWINAPFAAVPEGAREVLGKVAIVTLVNAIGVLAYVLIFRKH